MLGEPEMSTLREAVAKTDLKELLERRAEKIFSFYRAALADIDRGRSLDAVRDLVRSLEGFLTRRRGPETARTFHDRMAPLL